MRFVVASFVVSAFAVGCAEPNELTGSISDSHDLTFETVELRLLAAQAAYELKYLLPLEGGGGDDVVAKLVFDQPDGGITADDELDLIGLNVKVERITAANDPFPPSVTKAVATFKAGGNEAGEQTTGEFSSTFDNGKTLNGTFDVELEVVDF
jgi:hypothetical protein